MTEEVEVKSNVSHPAPPSAPYRVKVYKLNMDSVWEDKGTGHCVYVAGSEGELDELWVRSDENSSTLLSSKVQNRRRYHRQQETLIVWSEDTSQDLALSFQEPEGCDEIWLRIKPDDDPSKPCTPGQDGDLKAGDRQRSNPGMTGFEYTNSNSFDFQRETPEVIFPPAPEISNLSKIASIVTSAKTPKEKERLSAYIFNENYIDKLLPIFETCEDLESIDDLHTMFTIMKTIILLNDATIIDYIIRDEIVLGVMGMLEYDPETPTMKAKHREFLAKHSKVEQVVTIKDEATMSKIHQTFRLQYLKDVILESSMDESMASALRSAVFYNHVDILTYVQNNNELLTELFGILKDEEASDKKKRDAVLYVQSLCSITKPFQASSRASLYRSLAPYGLFDIFDIALTDEDISMRTAGLDMLASIVELNACLVRGYMIKQSKDETTKKNLLEIIVKEFTADKDHILKCQYAEVIRTLLDSSGGPSFGTALVPETLNRQDPETDEFLTLFYEKYAPSLLQPIQDLDTKTIKLTGPVEILLLTHDQAELILYISELLTSVVKIHTFRSKFLVLSSDCFGKVVQLFRSRDAHMKLAALRLVRACVGLKDEFYNRHLVKHDIFEPIIRVLLDTDGRDNLLNSACLELFDFIRKENCKILVNHLETQFGSVLDTITYVDTCEKLRLRHEQNSEQPGMEDVLSTATNGVKTHKDGGWLSSTMDDDEEEYFNGSEEEEEDSVTTLSQPQLTLVSQTGPKKALVDYEDDEDEDEEESKSKPETESPVVPKDDSSPEDESNKDLDMAKVEDPSLASIDETESKLDGETSGFFKRRKTSDDEEDDEGAFTSRPDKGGSRSLSLNSPKKIIINPRIKKTRTQK
ncbi:component of IIS longevity pathway SMK-1-domain-containing protein [Phycomyces nitens]|nr:component of IIS longevity pathway SMK-1-domain-containing protein [Phycomyces nitens]